MHVISLISSWLMVYSFISRSIEQIFFFKAKQNGNSMALCSLPYCIVWLYIIMTGRWVWFASVHILNFKCFPFSNTWRLFKLEKDKKQIYEMTRIIFFITNHDCNISPPQVSCQLWMCLLAAWGCMFVEISLPLLKSYAGCICKH